MATYRICVIFSTFALLTSVFTCLAIVYMASDKIESSSISPLTVPEKEIEKLKQNMRELLEKNRLLEAKYKSLINCEDITRAQQKISNITKEFWYITQSQYELLECSKVFGKNLKETDILFGIITGKGYQQRYEITRRTWAKDVPRFFFSDHIDSPEFVVSARTNNTNDYAASQYKFYDAIIHAHNLPQFYDKYEWFFLADDDTHVNIPVLLQFAKKWDTRMPVYFCWVWDMDKWPEKFCAGGAGTLFSKASLKILATALINNECKFLKFYSDFNLAICAHEHGVVMVHSNLFNNWAPTKHYDDQIQQAILFETLSFHRAPLDEYFNMSIYQNEYWTKFYDVAAIQTKQYRPTLRASEWVDVQMFNDEVTLSIWQTNSAEYCKNQCYKTPTCNWWHVKEWTCTLKYLPLKGSEITGLNEEAKE